MNDATGSRVLVMHRLCQRLLLQALSLTRRMSELPTAGNIYIIVTDI